MYGGYGSAWGQASGWPNAAGGVPAQGQANQASVQGQQSVFTTNTTQQAYQQQQQAYMAYTGSIATATNPVQSTTPGLMGYMNMGVANPFMNYGAAAYGMNPVTTTATTAATSPWLGNFNFQQFPGGRPPLPPGPPPPDKPKDSATPNDKVGNQPPLPPSQNNLKGAQPPPPPPPPAQQQQQTAGPSAPLNPLNPEDALSILKSAAALGMLPSTGPLTSLNVSEELFGTKNKNTGIPGLDFSATDDDRAGGKKSPEPEVIDLEKDSSNKKGEDSGFKNNSGSPNSNNAQKPGPSWTPAPKTDDFRRNSKTPEKTETKKEIVWELRPEVRNEEWKLKDDDDKQMRGSTQIKRDPFPDNQPNVGGFGKEIPKRPETSTFGQNNHQAKDSHPTSSRPEGVDPAANKQNNPPVRIQLDPPGDGKELVYDRKTLKQFDQKFREWENDFEKWKRANENHPDRAMYNKYLSQWNLWREQLVEQRRSIMDKMTKARLESTENIISKLKEEVFYSDDFSNDKFSETESVGAASNSGQQRIKGTGNGNQKNDAQSSVQRQFEHNPFETAMKGNRAAPEMIKRNPPVAPNLSKLDEMPGNGNHMFNFSKEKPPFSDSQNDPKMRERVRPVEKISRDGGGFEKNTSNQNPFDMQSSKMGDENKLGIRRGDDKSTKPKEEEGKSERENSSLPFEWSLPSHNRQNKNPFEVEAPQGANPFAQPACPNPFDMKPQQKLPSLDDFIKRTNLDFSTPVSITAMRAQPTTSSNPFMWSTSAATTTTTSSLSSSSTSNQVERIPRDPQNTKETSQTQTQNQQSQNPVKPLRLEANPVGMPLLIAAKEDTPPPKKELDEFSQLFSRDRGPPPTDDYNENSNIQIDDDDLVFGDDTEVVDFGAGGNSMDSLDFPRGEKPGESSENVENDDFSLEDSEVIDYSQIVPAEELEGFTGSEYGYGEGYPPEFEHGYPPGHYGPPGPRGRGRGRGFPPWGRGHPRGFPPGHPYYGRGMPMPGPRGPYPPPPDYGPMPFRGRPYGRGMFMGRGMPPPGYPPHHPEWYHHDAREDLPPPVEPGAVADPEVVELSPSPSPEPYGPKPPPIKIAPPNPEFERRRSRSRSRSRERLRRSPRERSRSRDRVSRRGRDSSSSDRRERDRDRRRDSPRGRDRRSPDRRGRDDRERERDRERDRDRYSRDRRRSRSRSKSPHRDRQATAVVRNPLFPSASAGMMGSYPASNPPPPRYQSILIEDILNKPGRSKRPPRIVIFMRGLPGSGKSHIVKLIKEREVEMGGKAPRILSLDNYFTTEIEKKVKDPVTGVEEKKTVMEYEYDEEREPLYRAQLVRQFKKTLDEGYFSFVIVDCVNEYVRQFEEMANFASLKRFQVYVAEIEESVDVCAKRNIHKRTKDEISKISQVWERTPGAFIKLDTRTLLQDEAVQDVEMEDVSDMEADIDTEKPPAEGKSHGGNKVVDLELEDIDDDEDSADNLLASAYNSKWDTIEPSQEKLNKLDGLKMKRRSDNEDAAGESESSIEGWLRSNMPDDYMFRRQTVPGQKRVRWADIEERREQERMREVGFVVGHTDWKRMMDPTFGSSALTRTKFI